MSRSQEAIEDRLIDIMLDAYSLDRYYTVSPVNKQNWHRVWSIILLTSAFVAGIGEILKEIWGSDIEQISSVTSLICFISIG